MIGEIYSFITPYFNSTLKKNSFKSRPVLIIGKANIGDYNVLPISRVTHKVNLDANFDIPIDPNIYPKLGLKSFSYVRTHKQMFAHQGELINHIGNMKVDYEDLYLAILIKLEEYNKTLISNAL